MLKGVNRQIIEVSEPDSIYFEKAVFYLRPCVRKLPAEISKREIDRLLSDTANPYRIKRRRMRIVRFGVYAAIFAVIAAILVIIL